jgi:hypothetical protein
VKLERYMHWKCRQISDFANAVGIGYKLRKCKMRRIKRWFRSYRPNVYKREEKANV